MGAVQAARAIVHLDAFSRNFRAIRERVGPQRLVCPAVKADAYGHGAAVIARASLAAGASFLGIARAGEGAALREEGIDAPILLFSQPLPEEIPEVITNRLIPLVSDGEFAALLDRAAAKAGVRLPVHLKIDTGMGRMGCPPGEAAAVARQIAACAALEYAGTATHLAVADSAAPDDRAFTGRQIACFNGALDSIRAAGLNPGIVHAANSGAIILHPAAWFDMVRPGIVLYGYNMVSAIETADTMPIGDIKTSPISRHLPLKRQMPQGITAGEEAGGPAALGLTLPPLLAEPVMELRTNVILIKPVRKGEAVSSGRTWAAPQDTHIAVLSVGYADGLPRLAGNQWQAVMGGKTYPLVGRVCMDQCMADIGPGPAVRRWDEATLFGGPAPSAAVLAERVGTIPYEITCNINKRVPRVYEGAHTC
jgi:alanine racemase